MRDTPDQAFEAALNDKINSVLPADMNDAAHLGAAVLLTQGARWGRKWSERNHSSAIEDIEKLLSEARERNQILHADIKDLHAREDALRAELAEAKREIERYESDYYVRKSKGIDTLNDENKRMFGLLEATEKQRDAALAEIRRLIAIFGKDRMDDWRRIQDAEREVERLKEWNDRITGRKEYESWVEVKAENAALRAMGEKMAGEIQEFCDSQGYEVDEKSGHYLGRALAKWKKLK